MRHEKYGSLATANELLLFDILTELKAINEKLTPAPAPVPKEEGEVKDVVNTRQRKRTI